MIKNIIKWIIKICIFVFVYLLQIYVINNASFFGTTGDLCLMAIVATSLLDNNLITYITAGICGLLSDLLFSVGGLKYIVIYIIVVAFLIELKKMYKQDSKLAIIIFSILATVISQVIMLVFAIIENLESVNVFSYIFMIVKEGLINICLSYFIYLVLKLVRQEE